MIDHQTHLTLSWRWPLSYRNQSTDLLRKSMDWFLYDNGLRHERVKRQSCHHIEISQLICANQLTGFYMMATWAFKELATCEKLKIACLLLRTKIGKSKTFKKFNLYEEDRLKLCVALSHSKKFICFCSW